METIERIKGSVDQMTPAEDAVTKSIERQTARIPSGAMLALALGAMGVATVSQLSGRGKWGNFIAQWVPTILIMGVYNKLVKLEGHDQTDREWGSHERKAANFPGGIAGMAGKTGDVAQSEAGRSDR